MKIPFTNVELVLNTNAPSPTLRKRPLIFGRGFARDPQVDINGMKMSFNSLYTAYRNQGDIYGCIREWRENVGAAGWRLVDDGDNDAEVPDQAYSIVHPVLNGMAPWRTTKNRIVRDYGVAGNVYLHKVKSIEGNNLLGLQSMDPRTMAIITDKYGTIHKYVQRVGYSDPVFFEPDEVIHIKNDTDPNHEVFGFSPMEPILWEARTDLAAAISNYKFFENDATPSVQYIMDEKLSDEEVMAAVKAMDEQFKGAANRHKSAILSGVKEIKTISMTQKDMEFLEGRKFVTDKICAAYGVPKFRLGYTDSVNNNNGIELTKNFYEGTIIPIEEVLAQAVTKVMKEDLGLENYSFEFIPYTLDRQEQIEERALAELRAGAITLRQYKKKTGQDIMDEDEAEPNIDRHIIHQGAGAVLLEDVGVDPLLGSEDPDLLENAVKQIEKRIHNEK